MESSLSERPEHQRPRRLTDWLNPMGARKAHSLIDKVYKRKNLEIAWKKVKANQGAGGVDGESIEAFGERLDERLGQLHEEPQNRHVSTTACAAAAHSEAGQAKRAEDAGHPDDLRSGMSAGAGQ